MKSLFLILSFALATKAQATTLAHQCKTTPTSTGVLTYCFETPKSTATKSRITYLFHGINGSAEDFFSGIGADAIQAMEKQMGEKAPLFIGLSLGPQGIIRENATELATKTLPLIESEFSVAANPRRDLIGQSMGGHNLFRLAAAAPSMFQSAAALCPALIPFNPFDQAQVIAYFGRHQQDMDVNYAGMILQVFAQNFANADVWSANNPFTFLNNGAYDHLRIFISVGLQDTLGFEEGSQAFYDTAQKRNINSQYAPVAGPHCRYDVDALQKFESN